MILVNYRVYLSAEASVLVPAAKLNTGEERLWFFDQKQNLIALFKWANILGYTIEGSAEGQVLTDKIPLEMGNIAETELGVPLRTCEMMRVEHYRANVIAVTC